MRTLLVQVMLACVAFVLIGDVLWRAGSLAWQHASGSTIEARGTPPPPYTDPQLTTTNALGGIGRTQGWEALVSTGGPQADLDILSDAVIPADILADVTAPSTTYFTRFGWRAAADLLARSRRGRRCASDSVPRPTTIPQWRAPQLPSPRMRLRIPTAAAT